MGRPPRTRNKAAIAIRQRSEGVRFALGYLKSGHPDLALEHLKLGIEAIEDLAGVPAAALRLAEQFLSVGMEKEARIWLEAALVKLGEIAEGETKGGRERFEASEAYRHAQLEREQEEAKAMIGRKKCQSTELAESGGSRESARSGSG